MYSKSIANFDSSIQCDIAMITIKVLSDTGVMAMDDYMVTDKNTPFDIFPLENDQSADGHPIKLTEVTHMAQTTGECVMVSDYVTMYII